MENIDTKLETIQNYYNYLGSILTKGYNNDINELNNIIKGINENDSDESSEDYENKLFVKQNYYNYKKNQKSLFSLNSLEENNDEDDNKSESDKSESDKSESYKSESDKSESDSENESRISLYDRFFGKNTSNPSNENTDKVEIFWNKSIDTEKILLYKLTTKYIKKLKHYMELIKNY
jgi:hypothetical protein